MAEQACQKIDHGARHAGDLDEQAEKHEERHRQQDDVRHALVHARDDDRPRHVRRQREIGESADAEGKRDRHRREHAGADKHDEEHDKLVIADGAEQRLRKDQRGGNRRNDDNCKREITPTMPAREPQRREDQHEGDADRQRRRAPDVGNFAMPAW